MATPHNTYHWKLLFSFCYVLIVTTGFGNCVVCFGYECKITGALMSDALIPTFSFLFLATLLASNSL
jgi:hypothetical protein